MVALPYTIMLPMVFPRVLFWVLSYSSCISMIYLMLNHISILNYLQMTLLFFIPILIVQLILMKHMYNLIKYLTGAQPINSQFINSDKTNFIVFSTSKRIFSRSGTLSIGPKQITEARQVSHLGEIFDQHLTWKAHIKYVCTKINPKIGILSKLRHYVQNISS